MVRDELHDLAIQVAKLSSQFESELGSEQRLGNLQLRLTELRSEVKAIRKLLSGNGTLGIVTRLDRLEQNERRRQVVTGAAAIAVIGVAVQSVWAWLVRGG